MNKEFKKGTLAYNEDNDRYGILDNMDLFSNEGLHCGETFEVFINNEWIADRIEMSRGQWYLVNSKLASDELEGLKVRY